MKIMLTTMREIASEDFWNWAQAIIESTPMTKENLRELWETGETTNLDDQGFTKAISTYRIIER